MKQSLNQKLTKVQKLDAFALSKSPGQTHLNFFLRLLQDSMGKMPVPL